MSRAAEEKAVLAKEGVMFAILKQLCLLFLLKAPVWVQEGGWQKEWSDVIARAKQERKVTVLAPPDPETRVRLLEKGWKPMRGPSLPCRCATI